MTPQDFLDGLGASPDFFLQDVDLVNRRGLLLKIEEDVYRRASFLDNRAFTRQVLGVWLPLGQILERADRVVPAAEPLGIFHVSHCGSTLISRLLAELPGNLPLREPLALLALAVERRELNDPASRLNEAGWERLLGGTLKLLSRSYRPGERACIKATSACGNLLEPFLAEGQRKALLLYTDLETWLTVMLRDEDVRHNGRFYAQAWLKDLHGLTGRRDIRLAALGDAEQFAVNWLTAMLHFERARQRHGNRVRRCDFESFLADPARELEAAGRFLGLDTARAAEVTAGPLMQSYAKNPSDRFDRETRRQELKETRARAAAEIAAGLKFAEKLCGEIKMLAPVGAYLSRSQT